MVDEGTLTYDSDYYGDDLPLWDEGARVTGCGAAPGWCPTRWTPTTCALPAQGFAQAQDFFIYLRDSALMRFYAEGDPNGLDRPKMMRLACTAACSVALGAISGAAKFMDHITKA